MNPFWRNLAVTVVVALLAGAAGGWLGARAPADDQDALPLRQTVHDIVRTDLKLSAAQQKQIQTIEDRYFDQRTQLRNQVANANRELADALMADMSFGREAQTASNDVEHGLGELQRATILYVLDVRDVLNPEQQMIYDRRVREVLTATVAAKP